MKTTLAVLLLVSSVAYGGPVVKCVEPGNTLDVQLPAALFDAANAGVAIRSSFNDGSTASCVATF
jgi:hypothetical protein